MIIDLNELSEGPVGKEYDVCIAGGGVAGITLAISLAKQNRRVALLEAGGEEYSDESQSVYRGESVGRPYFELEESRLRFLGGTSNHWGGWCRPFEARDFLPHAHVPLSGWPIAKEELDGYLAPATEILEIDSFPEDQPVSGSQGTLKNIAFRFSPPVVFGQKYFETLKAADNIDLYLNANLVEIDLAPDSGRVSGFICKNYSETSPEYRFTGTVYTLALGAIENARLLLASRRQRPDGVGNGHGLVGQYFMEHYHALAGYYAVDSSQSPFVTQPPRDQRDFVHYAPTEEFLQSAQIGSGAVHVLPIRDDGESFLERGRNSLKRLLCTQEIIEDFIRSVQQKFKCPPPFDVGGFLRLTSEQVPNAASRVALSEQIDRFGMPRVKLNWQSAEIDRRTITEIATEFARYFVSSDLGRVKLVSWMLEDDSEIPGVGEDRWLGAGWHQMGTTRMAARPSEGVVDANCRVFDAENLYMAGSSIFPTGGHANPTLPIVQLTLRLADHLNQQIGTG